MWFYGFDFSGNSHLVTAGLRDRAGVIGETKTPARWRSIHYFAKIILHRQPVFVRVSSGGVSPPLVRVVSVIATFLSKSEDSTRSL